MSYNKDKHDWDSMAELKFKIFRSVTKQPTFIGFCILIFPIRSFLPILMLSAIV